jgi:hypothetical protein
LKPEQNERARIKLANNKIKPSQEQTVKMRGSKVRGQKVYHLDPKTKIRTQALSSLPALFKASPQL